MLKTKDLFDLSHTLAADLLAQTEYPWQALPRLEAFLWALGPALPQDEYSQVSPGVWVHREAFLSPSAFLGAPCVIGKGVQARHGAFVRGSALIGSGAVVGNSTEIKNAVLFDGAQAPHFNYVGDSILGHQSHLGAGAVTSNVKGDKTPVTVRQGEAKADTGLKKLGAMVGDRGEVGCGCVLNPGCVIGKGARIYPLSSVRGTVPPGHIYKSKDEIVPQT